MINLLPDDVKRQIRAARTNIQLMKCVAVLGFAIVFLTVASLTVYFSLKSSETAAQQAIRDASKTNAEYATVKNSARLLSTRIKSIKRTIGSRLSYADIITNLAATMPTDTVIDSLTISDDQIGVPISITFKARSSGDNQQLKDNFATSKLFSKYTVKSVDQMSNDPAGFAFLISSTFVINKAASI